MLWDYKVIWLEGIIRLFSRVKQKRSLVLCSKNNGQNSPVKTYTTHKYPAWLPTHKYSAWPLTHKALKGRCSYSPTTNMHANRPTGQDLHSMWGVGKTKRVSKWASETSYKKRSNKQFHHRLINLGKLAHILQINIYLWPDNQSFLHHELRFISLSHHILHVLSQTGDRKYQPSPIIFHPGETNSGNKIKGPDNKWCIRPYSYSIESAPRGGVEHPDTWYKIQIHRMGQNIGIIPGFRRLGERIWRVQHIQYTQGFRLPIH